MIFILFLALLSGVVSDRRKTLGTWEGFACALSAWFSIILVNELLQHFLPYRKGQIGDVVYNTAGAGLGLLLSLKFIEL